MSPFAAEFETAAALLDEQFGDTITYHRGATAITVTGVTKGFAGVEDAVDTREPMRAELHAVDWTMQLSQLAPLEGVTDSEPDWIEDADGDRYTVVPVEGDQDWDYASPDKQRVRIRTLPELAAVTTTSTTTTPGE